MTDETRDPAYDVIQVVFIPPFKGRLEQWLESQGLELHPIPNGKKDGTFIFDNPADLPTYGIRGKG